MTAVSTDSSPALLVAPASLPRSARSAIPPELLTAHVTDLCGDAGFPILRAAAEALLRRLQIVTTEGLRVQQRPAAGFRGEYRTRRKRQKPRPHRTTLSAVEPLRRAAGRRA